jgi:hypothetical protein
MGGGRNCGNHNGDSRSGKVNCKCHVGSPSWLATLPLEASGGNKPAFNTRSGRSKRGPPDGQ